MYSSCSKKNKLVISEKDIQHYWNRLFRNSWTSIREHKWTPRHFDFCLRACNNDTLFSLISLPELPYIQTNKMANVFIPVSEHTLSAVISSIPSNSSLWFVKWNEIPMMIYPYGRGACRQNISGFLFVFQTILDILLFSVHSQRRVWERCFKWFMFIVYVSQMSVYWSRKNVEISKFGYPCGSRTLTIMPIFLLNLPDFEIKLSHGPSKNFTH